MLGEACEARVMSELGAGGPQRARDGLWPGQLIRAPRSCPLSWSSLLSRGSPGARTWLSPPESQRHVTWSQHDQADWVLPRGWADAAAAH